MPNDLFNGYVSRLIVAATNIDKAIELRDKTIRDAADAGTPTPIIAAACGLTRQRVWQIVKGV